MIPKIERQSNMELLRLISMMLIVTYHVFCYTLFKYETEYPMFKSFYTLTHVGVVIFVLISGYFGIKPSLKGLVSIYLSMVFYNVLLFSGWVFIGHNHPELSDYIKVFMPFSHSAPWLWFMKTYILLYLISPLLNKARDFKLITPRYTEQQKDTDSLINRFIKVPLIYNSGGNMLILVCFGFIVFYFGWLNKNGDLYDGRNVIEFAFLYLLGGFFRDRVVVTDVNRKSWRRTFLWAVLLTYSFVGTILYFASGSFLDLARWVFHPYTSPILILMASLLFLYFTTLEIQSNIINWMAGSTLAVYLVHENRFFEFIPWYRSIEAKFVNVNALHSFGLILLGIMSIMVIPILIDKIRLIVLKPIYKLFH